MNQRPKLMYSIGILILLIGAGWSGALGSPQNAKIASTSTSLAQWDALRAIASNPNSSAHALAEMTFQNSDRQNPDEDLAFRRRWNWTPADSAIADRAARRGPLSSSCRVVDRDWRSILMVTWWTPCRRDWSVSPSRSYICPVTGHASPSAATRNVEVVGKRQLHEPDRTD